MLVVDLTVLWTFVSLLGWAALCDVRDYVIPNRLCASIAVLYPAHVLASPTPVDWLGGLAVGGTVFAIGFGLFALRLTGAGDVKLFTTVALWAGPALLLPALIVTAFAGGILSLVALVRARIAMPRTAGGVGLGPWLGAALKIHVAYGIAIACGGLYVAGQLMVG